MATGLLANTPASSASYEDCVDRRRRNPLYRDVLKHYGAVALPCRVQDPDRKGKVESGIGHAQKTLLKGLRFESLEEAQTYLDRWEERWADTRIHGTTKRQVAAMFAEERPALLLLPVEPFRYYQYGERTSTWTAA
jgi:transposase